MWGIPIETVYSLAPVARVRRVPFAPPALAGVMEWQGEIVPVIDLSRRLGLPAEPAGSLARLLIVQGTVPAGETGSSAALQVDAVSDIRHVLPDQVREPAQEEAQDLPPGLDRSLVTGLVREGERRLWILDLPSVLRLPPGEP